MAKKIVAVRLKKLEYADVPATGLPSSWTEVDIIHEYTFEYTPREVTADPYNNELSGDPYYHDQTKSGELAISFSIGKYDLQKKATFQGGTYTAASAGGVPAKWVPATTKTPIYKAFKATTEDGVTVTFPKALVIANVKPNKKALGLAYQSPCTDTGRTPTSRLRNGVTGIHQ